MIVLVDPSRCQVRHLSFHCYAFRRKPPISALRSVLHGHSYHQIGSGACGLELHTLPAPFRDRLARLQDRWLHPRRALQTHPKTAGFRNLATDLLITENGELGSTCTRRRW